MRSLDALDYSQEDSLGNPPRPLLLGVWSYVSLRLGALALIAELPLCTALVLIRMGLTVPGWLPALGLVLFLPASFLAGAGVMGATVGLFAIREGRRAFAALCVSVIAFTPVLVLLWATGRLG